VKAGIYKGKLQLFVMKYYTTFQDKGVVLENQLHLVRKPENVLENVESDIGKLVSSKMKGVLEKDTIS
jgi:hypothetical protein